MLKPQAMLKPNTTLDELAARDDDHLRGYTFRELVRHVAKIAGELEGERRFRAREDDRLNSLLERMGREIPEEMEARSAALREEVDSLRAELDRVRESYATQEPRSTLTPTEGSGSVGIVDPGAKERFVFCPNCLQPMRAALVINDPRIDALLAAVDEVVAANEAGHPWPMTSRLREAREAFR